MTAIRVLYLTFKKDSHLKRGRFGRGFKEVLSVARSATVASGANEIEFVIEEGRQIARVRRLMTSVPGTLVHMLLPWGPETVAKFDGYFSSFLVPPSIVFALNGSLVSPRVTRFVVDANLPTEVYHPESHSWRKPRRKTTVELVDVQADGEPFIYEMGIPVAAAEWSAPFHANILQRVPMNPNRDALASGFAKSVHTVCLPVLLPEFKVEEATADWVGAAGVNCDEDVQRQIIYRAFGENAVRSVPVMGKRDFDHDAERVGAAVVKTAQMSGGFRDMARLILPSSQDRVREIQKETAEIVARVSFSADDVGTNEDERLDWVKRQGGHDHVQRCLAFAVWFCQQLVNSTTERQLPVTGGLALGSKLHALHLHIGRFAATWSEDNRLTLALEQDCFWTKPIGGEALSVLVHEAAHAMNMHHGKGFHSEVERLAGVAAAVMFERAGEIRQTWPDLVG